MKQLVPEFVSYVTKCVNICVTSYVSADNSRPKAHRILKGKDEDWSIQKYLFHFQNKIKLYIESEITQST